MLYFGGILIVVCSLVATCSYQQRPHFYSFASCSTVASPPTKTGTEIPQTVKCSATLLGVGWVPYFVVQFPGVEFQKYSLLYAGRSMLKLNGHY
eukprot:4983449-Amphidinium_carterae.1